MKTNLLNASIIFSLHLGLVGCSKMESNDMVFKQTVSEASTSASPTSGENLTPMTDPSVVIESDGSVPVPPVVVITPVPVPSVEVATPPAPPVIVATPIPVPPVEVATPAPVPPVIVATPVPVPPVEVATPIVVPPVVLNNQPEAEKTYPESAVPECKFDLTMSGLGSAAKVAVASAPKADLMGTVMKGFEALSIGEISAMRDSIESMKSENGVQFLSENSTFDKQFFKNNSLVLLVVQSKPGKVIDMSGLGKDAQIFVMIVSQEHNTVCLRTNGNSSMGELSLTAQTTQKYAARASVLINGNGSVNSYLKVSGGHRSGSKYEGKSIKDSNLTFITDGKNDTFTSVKGNGVSNSEFLIQMKGSDNTNFEMTSNFLNTSEIRMEIQGEEGVSAMMNIDGKMESNAVSGWLKAKTGGVVDSKIEDFIEVMPLP